MFGPFLPFPSFPFGSSGSSYWGTYAGFVYANVPAFTAKAGDTVSFDLGLANDYTLYFDIAFSDTTVNGGSVQSGFTTVCTDCTAGTPGNSVTGDYELTFTLDTAFTHAYGGLIIRFADGASTPTDSSCTQVRCPGNTKERCCSGSESHPIPRPSPSWNRCSWRLRAVTAVVTSSSAFIWIPMVCLRGLAPAPQI